VFNLWTVAMSFALKISPAVHSIEVVASALYFFQSSLPSALARQTARLIPGQLGSEISNWSGKTAVSMRGR
jgi:hypothetical protein